MPGVLLRYVYKHIYIYIYLYIHLYIYSYIHNNAKAYINGNSQIIYVPLILLLLVFNTKFDETGGWGDKTDVVDNRVVFQSSQQCFSVQPEMHFPRTILVIQCITV